MKIRKVIHDYLLIMSLIFPPVLAMIFLEPDRFILAMIPYAAWVAIFMYANVKKTPGGNRTSEIRTLGKHTNHLHIITMKDDWQDDEAI